MRRLTVWFLCVGMLLFALGCSRSTEASPVWELICIDVGQGHCTLFRTPEGDVLIDAGPESSQSALCQRLRSLGVEQLDLMILTHPDEDHIGGADGILEQFEVDEICTNGAVTETDSFERLMETAKKQCVPIHGIGVNDGFSIGGAHIGILSASTEEDANTNDSSLVLLIRCAEFSALIMADVSSKIEMSLIESYGVAHLQADAILVGHHGANSSTCTELLEAAQPQYAVISCGAGNSYGHPDGRVLERLENADLEILRTDLDGDVRFAIYENKYDVCKEGDRK